jgi:hypothetical protein
MRAVAANRYAEHDGTKHRKLRRQEFERPHHARCDGFADHRIAGMAQREEAVIDVPENIRRHDNGGHDQRHPALARAKKRRCIAVEPRREQHAGHKVNHGVFCQQPRADRASEHKRPAPIRMPAQVNIGEERQRPKQPQRHVGCNDARRKYRAGTECDQHCGPKARRRVIERPANPIGQQTCAEAKKRRGGPDAGFRVAAYALCGCDQPCEQWRFGEIAERQLAGP